MMQLRLVAFHLRQKRLWSFFSKFHHDLNTGSLILIFEVSYTHNFRCQLLMMGFVVKRYWHQDLHNKHNCAVLFLPKVLGQMNIFTRSCYFIPTYNSCITFPPFDPAYRKLSIIIISPISFVRSSTKQIILQRALRSVFL